jgi:molecular chaperone GrpE (heat shock protein)
MTDPQIDSSERPLPDRPVPDRPLGDRPVPDRPVPDRPLADRPFSATPVFGAPTFRPPPGFGARGFGPGDAADSVAEPLPPRPRRPSRSALTLRRRERHELLRRLCQDTHQVTQVLENLSATQAALADILTGRARELRRDNRDLKRKYMDSSRAVQGLEGSLETVRRDNADLRQQLADRDKQIADLQAEYKRLQESQSGTSAQSLDDERLKLFHSLGNMLVQLPTVRNRVEGGAPVTGKDVVGMLKPLDSALGQLGFTPIGTVGETLPYDEQLHQPAGNAERVPRPGENVRVSFVGYRYKNQILRKAQVVPVG